MNSTATAVATSPSTSPSAAAAASRRNRRALRQAGGGGDGGETAAEAARAARRNRIAGTGVPTSPNSAASPSPPLGHANPNGSGASNGGSTSAASPSVAKLAAAFDDLGMPSATGGSGSRPSDGVRGNSSSGSRRTSAASTRNGSVRRSGNTILSGGGIGSSNATNATATATGRVSAVPSPQDVADEFVVGRRRLQQQQQLPQRTVSPSRSRNMAAVRNYVASTTAAKTNTTSTPTTVESPSQTPSTSNQKQPLRVDTHSSTATASPSVASPDTHLGSANSSELGSLASPAAASTAGADSLAYSQNTSKSSSAFGVGVGSGGGGGFGEDRLSGQATNDIPATRRSADVTNRIGAGRVGASTSNGEWATAAQPQPQTQPQPQPQPRLQMRSGAPSNATSTRPATAAAAGRPLNADSVDDNFDEGTPGDGGGSLYSRYDDLSKLSSQGKHQDRVMPPADERSHLVNLNGTWRSFDSYENKSHATAIVYGHDASGTAGGSGFGSGNAGAPTGSGGAAQDGTSIDVVSMSFSPTQQGNGHSTSQVSVDAGGGGRPQGTFDDEDTNTVGSQLTDDRSWSRSVNLRQQHLRAQGRDYDDDADSRGSRRRQKSGKDRGKNAAGEGDLTGWALNTDDLNHFKEQVDQPQVKAALGASAAVVAGAAIFGPAGVLLGAAAVGLGVGVMQMPEEQRSQMKDKATAAAQQTYESAQIAAEAMGTTCATACIESGVADKIDPKFAKFVEDGAHNGCGATIAATDLVQHNPCMPMEGDTLSPAEGNSVAVGAASTSKNGSRATNGQIDGLNQAGADDSGSEKQVPKRRRKVACMRKGRIVPVGQIHSLEPLRQPKAWLDVMASANTSRDEKDEAMEELSIFIKDKYTAHSLLDEGILDSLLYIVACFFRNQGGANSPDGILPMSIRSDPEFLHAKKAANCCVNLGKAHCAIVHTEADDLLMSAYSNGAVPMERQLAQMLHEIPHHTSLPTTPANKQTAEGGDVSSSSEFVFTLTELSLQHAERLATSILALSQGRVVV